MRDESKTKKQLIEELTILRKQVADLTECEAEGDRSRRTIDDINARWSAIIKTFEGFISVCSQDYRVEFMNERLIERIGYDGTGEFCHKVFHERDSICQWCVNERVFRGETIRWEMKSPKDDRWFYVVSAPIYNVDGTVSRISLGSDITDRKRAEEAFKQSERRLLDIVNFLPDATLVIDKEGKIIAWNRTLEEMTGVKAADMLGKGNYEYALPFYGKRRPVLIDLVLKPEARIEAKYEGVEREETFLSAETYLPSSNSRNHPELATLEGA